MPDLQEQPASPSNANANQRANTDRSGADRAGADRAGADRAGADRAGADRAGADRAGAARVARSTPTAPGTAPHNGHENNRVVNAPPANAHSPKSLDVQRARHILDRAFMMSERGDFAGAVVACRQSIGLAPHEAASHSMLGFLLERSGDFKGAIAAYEKALQIAPDSPLEREGLRRLLAQHGATRNASAAQFQFDENELFDEAVPQTNSAPTSSTRSAPASGAANANAANANAANANAARTIPANAPVPAVVSSGAQPVAQTSAKPTVKSAPTVDLDLSSRPTPTLSNPVSQTVVAPASVAPASVGVVSAKAAMPNALLDTDVVSSPTNWQAALRAYPTFWTRSLPLISVAGTSLLWMLWAQNSSRRAVNIVSPVSQTVVENVSTDAPSASDATVDANNLNASGAGSDEVVANSAIVGNAPVVAPNAATANPNGAATAAPTPNGLFSSSWTITNKPQTSPSPSVANSAQNGGRVTNNRTNSSPNRVRRTNNADASNNRTSSTRTSGNRRRNPPAPRNMPPTSGTGNLAPLPPEMLPSTNVAPAMPLPRVPDAPRASSGASNGNPTNDPQLPPGSGGDDGGNGGLTPFNGTLPEFPNPTTSSQPSVKPPSVQPSSMRQPSTTLNSVNNRNAETAYRYQTRALLHIERGDNTKAIADFRSAIGFYNRQIESGIGVADARRGLEACRSGLRLVSAP